MSRWVVRVYALCQGAFGTWLVLEEYFRGGWIQKFPGGGVEPHESLQEALSRELQEELGASIEQIQHFYTTEFFQRSYYHENARLLAIYYKVKLKDIPFVRMPRLRLLWLPPPFMQLTFPVDRFVCGLLMEERQAHAEP
ncbi:MAG: NUDIX domain-containing protein [Bacteroidia bacterium]|nr:NUDIX domain-containing protein [Bacteroidia bacterium]MDW8133525.1 NUDIX domain-containing protein [Bacteroidia bacterium]